MILDKKQIRVVFLFKFKMGGNVAEATCYINVFGLWTENEKERSAAWFGKFSEGDEGGANQRVGPAIGSQQLTVESNH